MHLRRRLKCTIVTMRCPSSVRLSSLTFHIFDFSSETAEWKLTLISRSSTKFVFFGPIRKARWLPWPRLAETFSTSPLKPLNGIQQNLTGSKISTSSTKFVFFGLIGKTKWPPWPLIGWDIFSSPEPKALVSYCHSALSVVRPSVVRPSVNFSHFRLLLQNHWKDFDET